MKRTGAVSSDVVEGRFQHRLRMLHKQRLKQARTVLNDSTPERFAHLDPATKPPPREQVWRNRTIHHDNGLLVDKMVSILARKPQPNHDTELLTKAAHATVEDAYRRGPIPLPKSLNKDVRTRQLESMVLENEKFLARLISSPGVYSKRQWENQFSKETKYMEQICRFPYQDPTATMPQVNPILAIANAQSNRTAEWILKHQQQQQMQMQSMSQTTPAGTLPPLPGTPGFGQTQNFGSTFGSTSGSIPPYQSVPGVPNHFPSAPTNGAPLPTVNGGVVPVPPHFARPPTSAAAPGTGPKLRAQYTSQGVRIIKTGRSGGIPVRPSTSAGSQAGTPRGQTKSFQPLRQQQLQQQQQQSSRSPTAAQAHRPQPPATAAPANNQPQQQKEPQEQKEQSPVAATNDGATKEEESKEQAASGEQPSENAQQSQQQADQAQAAEAPPAADAVFKLFEDTLVISQRPVLIKIFECGGQPVWRLELRVFDPWSALEYTLCLPMTYIRLCFYQVPDLLLRSNRGFLLQTLLHYLAFAPSADGTSLELLVDIVAPPPRNPQEQLAWVKAQDEAALDQAHAELQAEKEQVARQKELQQEAEQVERLAKEAANKKQQEEFEQAKHDPIALAALTEKLRKEQEEQELLERGLNQQVISVQVDAPAVAVVEAAAPVQPPTQEQPPQQQKEETFIIHRGGSHAHETHLLSPQPQPPPATATTPTVESQVAPTTVATDPSPLQSETLTTTNTISAGTSDAIATAPAAVTEKDESITTSGAVPAQRDSPAPMTSAATTDAEPMPTPAAIDVAASGQI